MEAKPKGRKRDEEVKMWELVLCASAQLRLRLRTTEVQKMDV